MEKTQWDLDEEDGEADAIYILVLSFRWSSSTAGACLTGLIQRMGLSGVPRHGLTREVDFILDPFDRI